MEKNDNYFDNKSEAEKLRNVASMVNDIVNTKPDDSLEVKESDTETKEELPEVDPVVDLVGKAIPDKALYSDAYLMVLSNKNNPIVEISFHDIFPISLGALEFTQSVTDIEYMTATAEFAYEIYEINTL